MSDESDRRHSLMMVFASAVMMAFCGYIIVYQFVFRQDGGPLFAWLFIGFAFIEAYTAYFLREPYRWAWAFVMFLAGAGLVARELLKIQIDQYLPAWLVVAFMALLLQIKRATTKVAK